MNKELEDSILSSIALTGSAGEENAITKPLTSIESAQILDFTSGRAKIKPSLVSKFTLILSQPLILAGLSNFSIRCTLCKRIISYPCWYHSIIYSVNVLHLFICFQPTLGSSEQKPNTKCYRRA